MGQALYRKYRSKNLAEIVGQEHITDTLSRALKQGRISHAYLLTGPRGVGKTSIARILAHEINNLPYVDDSDHMDIIEIDAASNRRIDEIRDLRERVHVAPTSAKYKVYIIDEVHMLTREAFNALLKTLEEPPAHVVFILATTDAHKLPETIVSRTQRYSFKPVEKSKVVTHLQFLADQEDIKVSTDALELLAEHGEGSFRDSISLLDQASSHGQSLKLEDVQRLLGVPPTQSIEKLLNALESAQIATAVTALENLYGQGYQAVAIAKQLGLLLRQNLINGVTVKDRQTTLSLLDKLINVPSSHSPDRYLEICLLQAIPVSDEAESDQVNPVFPVKINTPKPVITRAKEVVETVEAINHVVKPSIAQRQLDESIWPEVLSILKKKRNTLYGVVRMATPVFSNDGSLKLVFSFAFHQKRSNEAVNRQLLSDIVKELTGSPVNIEVVLDANFKPDKPATKSGAKPADLSAISNIFGDAKLLES